MLFLCLFSGSFRLFCFGSGSLVFGSPIIYGFSGRFLGYIWALWLWLFFWLFSSGGIWADFGRILGGFLAFWSRRFYGSGSAVGSVTILCLFCAFFVALCLCCAVWVCLCAYYVLVFLCLCLYCVPLCLWSCASGLVCAFG